MIRADKDDLEIALSPSDLVVRRYAPTSFIAACLDDRYHERAKKLYLILRIDRFVVTSYGLTVCKCSLLEYDLSNYECRSIAIN